MPQLILPIWQNQSQHNVLTVTINLTSLQLKNFVLLLKMFPIWYKIITQYSSRNKFLNFQKKFPIIYLLSCKLGNHKRVSKKRKSIEFDSSSFLTYLLHHLRQKSTYFWIFIKVMLISFTCKRKSIKKLKSCGI